MAHPLLQPFPLAVMTIATFLVIFTVLMARLTTGADPALHHLAGTPAVTVSAGGRTIVSRTSGGGVTREAAVATPATGEATPALVTRSSGGAGARDD